MSLKVALELGVETLKRVGCGPNLLIFEIVKHVGSCVVQEPHGPLKILGADIVPGQGPHEVSVLFVPHAIRVFERVFIA